MTKPLRLVTYPPRLTATESLEQFKQRFCRFDRATLTQWPDLNISVYMVIDEPEQITRASVEHMTSLLTGPVRGEDQREGIFLDGLPNVEPTRNPGSNLAFTFVRDSHAEVELLDEVEHETLVSEAFREVQQRMRVVPHDTMREYARSKLSGGDSEWASLCAEKPRWQKWIRGTAAVPQRP